MTTLLFRLGLIFFLSISNYITDLRWFIFDPSLFFDQYLIFINRFERNRVNFEHILVRSVTKYRGVKNEQP